VPKSSAGLLLFRRTAEGTTEVLLVHPGGPFWAKKDEAAWSIPKGEFEAEDPLAAAEREFEEELGSPAPAGERIELGQVAQSGAKVVVAWAVEGDFDTTGVVSNTFDMEWPPRSGRVGTFPEVDRAQWMTLDGARAKLLRGQRELLERLEAVLAGRG